MFTCKKCDLNTSKNKFLHLDKYWIYRCEKCNHKFVDLQTDNTHVEEIYDDTYFEGGNNAGYSDYFAEKELLIKRGEKYADILARYISTGSMLDVGAAAGFLLKGFQKRGWDGMGIEPNKTMAKYAQDELGINVLASPIEHFQSKVQFDLITMIQVIPHFYDLMGALENLAQHTKQGGHWMIETWNSDSKTARLMGKSWHEYSPPSVLHYFSMDTLDFMVQQFGFKRITRGRLLKQIGAAHAKSLLKYKFNKSPIGTIVNPLLKVVPDKMVIPYPSEDLFWALYQKEVEV